MYTYSAKVIRVLDGDTIEVIIDLGFDIKIQRKIRIIAASHKYFDTPETWRPKTNLERSHGEEATRRALELLGNKTITINSLKMGKYRYVARVLLSDGMDYGDLMISEGFQKRDSYLE